MEYHGAAQPQPKKKAVSQKPLLVEPASAP